jgi:hypothetical protein
MAALGAIRSVTVTTPNLEATAAAYRDFLGYVDAGSGQISPALAQAWACPGEAGQDYLLLKPASGVDFWMRLVATEPVADYRPLTSYGWNASEIIVQDVDQLAEQLADSPFQIIGPPEDLSFSDAIRAMQVRGPADEVVYLTQFKRPVPAFDVPDALSFVDRVFIMIVGGPDLAAIQRYYEETFAVPPAPVMDAVVSVLSDAFDLPRDQPHQIAALAIGGKCFIEADQYPEAAVARPRRTGRLPPATAMVSFACQDLEGMIAGALGPVITHPEPPYGGSRAGLVCGAAGELIELIQT